MIQPTVSHYREPLIRELLDSPRADFSLFGIRGASGTSSAVNRIRDASDDALDQVQLVDTYCFRELRWERGVVRTAIRGDFDALVLEGRIYTLSTLLALIVGRTLKRPVYLWGHGWKRDEFGIKRMIRVNYYRLAAGLLLYGDKARERAITYGLDRRKIDVVGNSIYSMRTLRDLPYRKTRSDNGTFRLIVSCRLTPRHHLELLADAMSDLKETLDIAITVVGDGSEREGLVELFARKDLKAEFHGAVFDEARLAGLYRNSDLAVSPAASGLNVIQALGFATPILVPDEDPAAGPEHEAVVHGRTGLKFRHGDSRDLARAIAAAAEDGESLLRMGSAGRKRVESRYVAEMHAQAITDAVLRTLCHPTESAQSLLTEEEHKRNS
ncbi:glycosyltransferase [Nocardioides cavernae]|uniref:glycosyltransferase family 4 protein n=1 Tax=Nocardioides cavernae TaxID=1921566 RepID=UPI00200F7561|nr:glycosyltransferase [Nocardioides cavernae]MCK9822181.1 glycosyltransferase [Nocardioides cavernae]